MVLIQPDVPDTHTLRRFKGPAIPTVGFPFNSRLSIEHNKGLQAMPSALFALQPCNLDYVKSAGYLLPIRWHGSGASFNPVLTKYYGLRRPAAALLR
jgi:hypothetical protein